MRPTVNSIVKSFQNSGKKHFLITGSRGIGKTTLFLRLKEILCVPKDGGTESNLPSYKIPGITTYVVPQKQVMLRDDLTEEETTIGRFRDGWMETVEAGFLDLGVRALNNAHTQANDAFMQWYTIDEIGFLESKIEEFIEEIRYIFDTKRVLAVLRKQDIPFLNELKSREDVYLIDMDEMRLNVGCIIMASGISKRFGSNKLLADFQGETLFERVLSITEGELFAQRVVVTRTKEIEDYCKSHEIEVILHDYSGRGDAIRLGMERILDGKPQIDGCLFCPCDQPFLQKKSLGRMVGKFTYGEKKIFRLGFGEEYGAPVLFSKEFFEELCHLPEKSGGSYLIKKYPEYVDIILAENEQELEDIDTKEDYLAIQERV